MRTVDADISDVTAPDDARYTPSAAEAAPLLPKPASGERQPLLPSQKGYRWEREDDRDPFAGTRSQFHVRRPMSDVLVRIFVVLAPLALAGFAALLGVHFQRQAAIFDRGDVPTLGSSVNPVKSALAFMTVIGIDGLLALSLWSGLIVTNTCRVCRSLRTPWFAAIGWMIAPALGFVAHLTLDQHLESGSLIGFTVFLAALYLPFGTLGGASVDLGGNQHLSRTWFLASVIGAFLLIVGISGATKSLPADGGERAMTIRSYACYLGAIMLVASSALAYATGRSLNAMISHSWTKENDPENVFGKRRTKIKRSGRQLSRSLTPTLFLRVIVAAGVLLSGLASVAIMLWLRGRALLLDSQFEATERRELIHDYEQTSTKIGAVALSIHIVYVVWAIVAARNAHRRSLMTPTPWAVFSAFLVGPLVSFAGVQFGGPFGAAVLTVGVVLTIGGFVVAQLILGRTVAALGGRGSVFLAWLIADFAMVLFTAFVAGRSDTRWQVVAFGVVQTAFTMIAAYMAWTAMTRLDHVCRDYRHSGSVDPADMPVPHSLPQPAMHAGVQPSQIDASPALTSSQS